MGVERKSLILTDEEKKGDGVSRSRARAGRGQAAGILIRAQGHDHSARHGAGRDHAAADRRSTTTPRNIWKTEIAIMMGGRIAEELFLNQMSTGAGNDIERATELARKMVCEWGMSDLGPLTFGKKEEQIFLGREIAQHRDYSEATAIKIDGEVRKLVSKDTKRPSIFSMSNRETLQKIARRAAGAGSAKPAKNGWTKKILIFRRKAHQMTFGQGRIGTRALSVHDFHHVLGIAIARGCAGGEDFVEPTQVVRAKLYVESGNIFLQILAPLGTGDGDDVVVLRQHPRQRKLRRLAAFLLRDLLDFVYEVEILLEVFSLETGRESAVVVRGEIFEALELSGEKPAAERAVGDEAYAEFTAGREQFVFRLAAPQGIFGLQRANGMNFCGPAQGLRGGFREPYVADLSFLQKLSHGADRFFDGRGGIDAVLVVEIDGLDSQALQAGFAGSAHVFRLAVHSANVGVLGIANDAEFRGQYKLIALALEGAADQFFVFVRTVDIGGIEKVDAEFERPVNGGDGFGVVAVDHKTPTCPCSPGPRLAISDRCGQVLEIA
jgi:hypothetical protein